MKTLEQLNQAVLNATAEIAKADEELEVLQDENTKLQDAVSANFHEQTEVRGRKWDAELRQYRAKWAVNVAESNAIAAEFGGMSREGILAGLRTAVRSKKPIAEDLVEKLEGGAHDKGVDIDKMSSWRECGGSASEPRVYVRNLSEKQIERVNLVLERLPRHPETDRYLPSWQVEIPYQD